MSEVESLINIPVEHCSNIFGQFDEYAKVIEKTLKVTIIVRDSSVKVIGSEAAVQRASGVLNYLYELSKRGNQITRQNVDYSIAQSFEERQIRLLKLILIRCAGRLQEDLSSLRHSDRRSMLMP